MARQIYLRDDIEKMGRDPVHRWRHSRYKGGEKMSNIAREDGVRLVDIRRSVHAIEMYDAMFNSQTLEANELRAMGGLIELEEKALSEMLQAKCQEEVSEGKTEFVADHQTRARAIELVNERLQILLDKRAAKGTTIGVNVAQQTSTIVQTSEGSASFESMLRSVQAKRIPLAEVKPAALPPAIQSLDVLDDEEPVREPVDAGSA